MAFLERSQSQGALAASFNVAFLEEKPLVGLASGIHRLRFCCSAAHCAFRDARGAWMNGPTPPGQTPASNSTLTMLSIAAS